MIEMYFLVLFFGLSLLLHKYAQTLLRIIVQTADTGICPYRLFVLCAIFAYRRRSKKVCLFSFPESTEKIFSVKTVIC